MAYQIDRNKCLCCHNCALECPVQAISYVGTGYTIDADKCIDCGHCARVCNVDAPVGGEAEAVTAHDPIQMEADIVVLGAGAAGIVAAARAAQCSGKRVLLLEKAKKYGGSGWFAGFMVPVPGEKPAMPPMFKDNRQTMLDGGIDPKVMELAEGAPTEFFQWLRELDSRVDTMWKPCPGPGGMTMDVTERAFFNKKNKDKAIGPGRSTSAYQKIVSDHFEELGVTLLTQHEAVALKKDENGAICGVVAKDPGGLVEIACRAVISCTGGFANNEAMMRTYAPHYYGAEGEEHTHRFAAPTNTGDVIALGESVGAYLDRDNFFANVFGPVHHPFSFTLFNFALQAEVLNLNMNGERFMDESRFGDGAGKIIHQPGRIAWSIMDSDTKDLLGDRAIHGPDGPLMSEYEAELEEEAAMDTPVKKADTLEELAEKCGIPVEPFMATIQRYNEYCKQGNDPEIGKRPNALWPIEHGPFYAIFGKVACDGAFGGMLINSNLEVYNADRSGVIPGLYACGDNASGWALRSKTGGDERLMVCNECNWAIGSGFVAGKNAAEYLK